VLLYTLYLIYIVSSMTRLLSVISPLLCGLCMLRLPQVATFHKHLFAPVRSFRNTSLFMRKKTLVGKSSILDIRSMAPFYKPKSANQGIYVKQLCDPTIPIVVGVGPAGSGKTLFACCEAVGALKRGEIEKIVITRPVVPVEEDIGFLPGSLIHKMDPWTRPLFDIFLEFYSQTDITAMLHNGILEISPLAYMRGRTFKRAFIIADEMQNSSPNQMMMLTTRIGDGSKMVITGDLKQSDKGLDNGLADFMKKIRGYERFCESRNLTLPNIRLVEMAASDIQRSPIVSKLIDIYSGDYLNSVGPSVVGADTVITNVTNGTTVGTLPAKVRNHSLIYIDNDAAMIPNYDIYYTRR
jgi:phosphate starvation-inducible PhoH-like protein